MGNQEYQTGVEYQEFLKKEIEEFNASDGKNLDTRVIFLSGDYGWGKTTMIKKVATELGKEKFKIYSPWLSVKDKNMLVDLWSSVTGFDLRKTYRKVYTLSLVGTSLIILAPLFSWILLNSQLAPFFSSILLNSPLASCFLWILANSQTVLCVIVFLIIATVITLVKYKTKGNKILKYISYKNNADQKFYGYYLEDIASRMPTYLVIEDVDRLERDELLELMKIVRHLSDVLKGKEDKKKERQKKTIILTGSAVRVILKCENNSSEISSDSGIEDSNSYSFATYNRVVQKTIPFISIENRIEQILREKSITIDFNSLEFKLFLNLIIYYQITIRDFDKMLLKDQGDLTGKLLKKFIGWYFLNKVAGKSNNFVYINNNNNNNFLHRHGLRKSQEQSYISLVEAELELIDKNLLLNFRKINFENIKNYYCILKPIYNDFSKHNVELQKYEGNSDYHNITNRVNQIFNNYNSSVFPDDIKNIFENWKVNHELLKLAVLEGDSRLTEISNFFEQGEQNLEDYNDFQIAAQLAFVEESVVESTFPNLYRVVCCNVKKPKKISRKRKTSSK